MYVSCQLVVILGNSIIVYNLSYVALCDNVDNMLFSTPLWGGGGGAGCCKICGYYVAMITSTD